MFYYLTMTQVNNFFLYSECQSHLFCGDPLCTAQSLWLQWDLEAVASGVQTVSCSKEEAGKGGRFWDEERK